MLPKNTQPDSSTSNYTRHLTPLAPRVSNAAGNILAAQRHASVQRGETKNLLNNKPKIIMNSKIQSKNKIV